MKWSEYNHHWMGMIVIAMGILALLARTGQAPWAEYWPLLMIGIAIFIFLRGDPECWPLGPKSFWATWANPEIFQHRAGGATVHCLRHLRAACAPQPAGRRPAADLSIDLRSGCGAAAYAFARNGERPGRNSG